MDKVTLNGWSTGETEISIFWSVTVSSWAWPLSLELSCPAKAGADVVDMMRNSKSTALITGFTLARKSAAVRPIGNSNCFVLSLVATAKGIAY